jgi:hypothetical protein
MICQQNSWLSQTVPTPLLLLVVLFLWCSFYLSAELLWMTLEQHARGERVLQAEN